MSASEWKRNWAQKGQYIHLKRKKGRKESIKPSERRLGRARRPCTYLRVFFRVGLGLSVLARVRAQKPRGNLGLCT